MAVWILCRKLGVSLGILCLLFLLASVGASAHAYLVATSPSVNASLTLPPPEIVIVYDEPVDIDRGDALLIRGKDGTRYPCTVATDAAAQRTARVSCTLRTQLARGVYAVSWRATSADSHLVEGTFSFGVGVSPYGFVDGLRIGTLHRFTAFLAVVRGLSDEPIYLLSTPSAIGLRWLILFGVSLLVGALGFERLALGGRAPAMSTGAAVLRCWCRRLSAAGALLALFASLAALAEPTALITKLDTANAAWLVRLGLLCIALVAIWSRRFVPLAYVAAALLPVSLIVSAGVNDSGHDDDGILHYVADWLHVSAASLFAGGLVVFAAVIRPALAVVGLEARPEFLREAIGGFSRIAAVSVVAIAVSGVYVGVQHVGSWTALFGTLYGRVVLAKVVLLTALVAFGYVHNRQKRGRSGEQSLRRRR